MSARPLAARPRCRRGHRPRTLTSPHCAFRNRSTATPGPWPSAPGCGPRRTMLVAPHTVRVQLLRDCASVVTGSSGRLMTRTARIGATMVHGPSRRRSAAFSRAPFSQRTPNPAAAIVRGTPTIAAGLFARRRSATRAGFRWKGNLRYASLEITPYQERRASLCVAGVSGACDGVFSCGAFNTG